MLGLLVLLLGAAWIEPLLVQRSFPRTITIGEHDLGQAQGWSAKEISETLPGSQGPVTAPYRWSGADSSLVFASVAQGQPYLVTLRLLSGQPTTPVRIAANQPAAGRVRGRTSAAALPDLCAGRAGRPVARDPARRTDVQPARRWSRAWADRPGGAGQRDRPDHLAATRDAPAVPARAAAAAAGQWPGRSRGRCLWLRWRWPRR